MKRNLTSTLVAVAFFAVLLLVFFFSVPSSSERVKTTVTEFAAGRINEAESLLRDNRQRIAPAQYHLYQAYLLRAKDQVEESNNQLKKALDLVKEEEDRSTLLLEIYLNQAMNAYIARDSTALHQVLTEAKGFVSAENGWIQFFSGLDEFINGRYDQASETWKDMNVRRPLSPWMEVAFNSLFTPFFLTNLEVRASIYQGNYIPARQQLNQALENTNDSQKETLNFLLGLTYIEEARGKSPVSATPYYKLAFNYFRHVPMDDVAYIREKEQILGLMVQVANVLVDKREYAQISFYLKTFTKWDEKEAYTALLDKLVGALKGNLDDISRNQVRALGVLLSNYLPEGDEKESLAEMMEKNAWQALQEKKIAQAKNYWWVAEHLSDDPDLLRQHFVEAVRKQILKEIPDDNEELSQTFPYIRLWQSLTKTDAEKNHLPNQLIQESKRLWKEKREHAKALKVLVTAVMLLKKNGSDADRELVRTALNEMFEDADKDNHIDAFALLFDVMRELNIPDVESNINMVKKKLLEEAELDLSEQRYQQAFVKSKWVLNQDPDNLLAAEIAAHAAFGISDYSEALWRLKALDSKDPLVVKRITISELLEGDVEVGQTNLEELERAGTLDDDLFFRLGTEKLLQGETKEALRWLGRIQEKTAEVEIAILKVNIDSGKFQEAVEIFEKLPKPYQQLIPVQGLAIIAYGKLGKKDIAQQMVKKLLQQNEVQEIPKISSPFRPLWIEKLKGLTPEAIVGQYYFVIENDQETALRYLNRLLNPTPEISALWGKVLIASKRYEEALQVLAGVPDSDENTVKGKRQLKKILPLLAEVYRRMGYYPESVGAYQRLFILSPEDDTYRAEYGMALEGVKRYDLALLQFEKLKDAGKLTDFARLHLIKAYAYTNKMKEANVLMQEWLGEEPGPSTLTKIKFMRLLIISEGYSLSRKLLRVISEQKLLDIDEMEEMVAFFIDTGNYSEAIKLLKKHHSRLKARPTGLYLLARFNLGISDPKKAISYAEQALELDPWFVPAKEFLQRYQKLPEIVKQRILNLQKLNNVYSDSLSLRLAYAAEVLKFAEIAISSTQMGETIASFDLYQITSALDRLSQENQMFPEVYALLGKGYYLLKKYSESQTALKTALKLAVAYPEASLTLANLELAVGDSLRAEAAAQQGLRYQRDDVDLLLTLANANQLQGNFIDAVSTLKKVNLYRPNAPVPYLALGKLYVHLSNPEGARLALERAEELMPDNKETLSFLLFILHDPLLFVETSDPKKLEQRQKEVFDRLNRIAPEKAAEIMEKVERAKEQ